MMQTQKVDKESEAYQAGGNIIINNGPSLVEVSALLQKLLELNSPMIVQQARDAGIQSGKELIQDFLSGLSEQETIKIKESLRKPSSQFLLKEGIENAARYGETADLKILSEAIKKAMVAEDDEISQLASSVCNIIPQLRPLQLSIIGILYFLTKIGMPEQDNIGVLVELSAKYMVKMPEKTSVSRGSKFHLISLGVCTFNQFPGGAAEDLLKKRYPKKYDSEIVPYLKEGHALKKVVDFYNSNSLYNFMLTPVGGATGFLITKEMNPLLDESLFGKF